MRRQHEHVYTWRSAPDSNRHTPFAKKEKKTTTSGNDKKQTSEFKHVILEHEQEIICIEDEHKKKSVTPPGHSSICNLHTLTLTLCP